MISKIKWGIIGPGKIANKFAEALSNVEGAELYAVASRNEVTAKTFAQKYGASVYYGSYDALVNDALVDIIYVATPHAFHKDATLLCLNNKKPVLCEKPLAHKYDAVKAMIEASIANNVFMMEAMWTRFLPPIEKALAIINAGQIGEVVSVKADFGFTAPFDPKSRLYDMALGGGSLMDVGVYPLFLALTILGEPNKIQSAANLSETGADKDCTIILKYSNAEALVFSSIVFDTKREASIVGTKGTIIFNTPWYRQTSICLELKDGPTQTFEFNYSGNGFEPQILEAMNCLRNGVIESILMPHRFSLLQSKVLEQICNQCGIRYA